VWRLTWIICKHANAYTNPRFVKPESDAKSNSHAKSESDAKPGSDAKSDTHAKSESDAKPDADAKSESHAEPDSDAKR
jgi:hypothetical protein